MKSATQLQLDGTPAPEPRNDYSRRRRPVLDPDSLPRIDGNAPPPPEPFQAPLAGCLAPGGGATKVTSEAPGPMLRCQHFTGQFTGTCLADVAYSDVCDQNRRAEPARYPCRPEDGAFTTCAKFTVNKTLKRVSLLCGRGVLINIGGYARKREYARLLAITTDGHQAFVLTAKGKHKTVAIGDVHKYNSAVQRAPKGSR